MQTLNEFRSRYSPPPRTLCDPEFRHSIKTSTDRETGYTDDVWCEWCGGDAWDLGDRQPLDTKTPACYRLWRTTP